MKEGWRKVERLVEKPGRPPPHELIRGLVKKKTTFFGNLSQHRGGGLPESQNFCKSAESFLACQIHS